MHAVRASAGRPGLARKSRGVRIPMNSSHFFWDHLIVRMGCPFLKRVLLRENPAQIPWQEVIQSATEYDTDLIARHLERTLRRRAV